MNNLITLNINWCCSHVFTQYGHFLVHLNYSTHQPMSLRCSGHFEQLEKSKIWDYNLIAESSSFNRDHLYSNSSSFSKHTKKRQANLTELQSSNLQNSARCFGQTSHHIPSIPMESMRNLMLLSELLYYAYCLYYWLLDVISVHQSPERRLSHTMLTLYPIIYRSRKKVAKVNA